MLNANINPIIMDRIPIAILDAVNPVNINAIPRKIKLIPMKRDNAAVVKTGQIIKINPKIMDNIPDTLFVSIYFPPNNLYLKLLFFHI